MKYWIRHEPEAFVPLVLGGILKWINNQATDAVILNQVQLVLVEKRTSLSIMRTGIAVFALPISVLSVLVATSKHYDIASVISLLIPLLAMCAGLVSPGLYLIVRPIKKSRRYDRIINDIKRNHSFIANLVS